MSNENSSLPIAAQPVHSSRREFHDLWTRHATALDAVRRTGDPNVPQIPPINARCKLVGLLPPLASEASGDHEAANVVIYIPDNGRAAVDGIGDTKHD